MREVLGDAVRDLSDPRIGFITITGVKVTRDMKYARVYFTSLGDDEARNKTQKALESSHGILQRQVARQVKLRNTPLLQFEYDDGIDTAMRIAEILEDGEGA